MDMFYGSPSPELWQLKKLEIDKGAPHPPVFHTHTHAVCALAFWQETEENKTKGFDYLLKAAEAGDRQSMILVARAFDTGLNLSPDRYCDCHLVMLGQSGPLEMLFLSFRMDLGSSSVWYQPSDLQHVALLPWPVSSFGEIGIMIASIARWPHEDQRPSLQCLKEKACNRG